LVFLRNAKYLIKKNIYQIFSYIFLIKNTNIIFYEKFSHNAN
jgi:hypothetical protein